MAYVCMSHREPLSSVTVPSPCPKHPTRGSINLTDVFVKGVVGALATILVNSVVEWHP